jgi:hypothetical protein
MDARSSNTPGRAPPVLDMVEVHFSPNKRTNCRFQGLCNSEPSSLIDFSSDSGESTNSIVHAL